MLIFTYTWSNLNQWIRDLIVRWQSDLVNTKGVCFVCVKRYNTNLKNILKLKEIKVCRTVHCEMLTVQVWHSLSKCNHMFKIQFFHTLVLYSSKHVSRYIWLISYKGIANWPYNDNSILIAEKQFTRALVWQ